MSMAYLFRNTLRIFTLPMILPASMMLKTGGINEVLQMTTSSLPSGSAITKSGLLNGFPRRRPEASYESHTASELLLAHPTLRRCDRPFPDQFD